MTWENAGVFTYVMPALLIFAFIFGILSTTSILGKNKGVHIIISLVIAFLVIREPAARDFILSIFGRAGIAIAIILVAVILTAIFIPDTHKAGWAIGIYSLGGLCLLFVVFNTFTEFNWFGTQWWSSWGENLLLLVLIGGIIGAIAFGGKGDDAAGGARGAGGTASFSPFR